MFHYLLACKSPGEKWAVIVIFASLYKMYLFSSGCSYDFLFNINFQQLDYDVSLCDFLHVSSALLLLSFLDLWIYDFQQV